MTQLICSVCIMDDTDPDIQFFGAEGCNHCKRARYRLAHDAFPGAAGEAKLRAMVARIKAEGRNKRYDCLIGISGGVDSSFVAWKAKQLGLRPLALHVDNGWNSELAVYNIQQIAQKLDIDLITHVIDWQEVRELQRACFRAPVLDIELVADHAIVAMNFKAAANHGIKYILNGSNVATESVMPRSWFSDKRDAKNLLSIYRTFGSGRALRTYPIMSPAKFLYYLLVKRIKFIPPLNYGTYNKAEAIGILQQELGWKPYPNKHGESVFTRFFQDHWLPAKFGIDKRKAHYSSLIAAEQMTREEALALMNKPLYRPDDLALDTLYVCEKLGFTLQEFEAIMQAPAIAHEAFANNAWMFRPSNPISQMIRRFAKAEA